MLRMKLCFLTKAHYGVFIAILMFMIADKIMVDRALGQPPAEDWAEYIGVGTFGVQQVLAVGYVNGEVWALVRWQHEPVPQYDEFDIVLERYDGQSGESLGEVNYGPHADDEDEWAYVIVTDGTNHFIGGACRDCTPTFEFSPNYLLIKADNSGNEIWRSNADQGTFRGTDSDEDIIRGIMIRSDGRIWVVGESFSDGRRMFLACFDANGQFNSTYSRAFTSYWASAYGLIPTPDNGALIYGIKHDGGDTFPLVLKVDQNGNSQWMQYYERGGGIDGYCVGAVRASDGYILAIMYNGLGGPLWLKKVDLSGNTVWDQDHADIHPYAMTDTQDNGFAIAGIDGGALSLKRFDSSAEVEWTGSYGSGVGGDWMGMVRLADGSYALGGTYYGQVDGIVVKTESEVLGANERLSSVPQEFVVEDAYPNPFNSRTIIKYELTKQSHVVVSVFDLTGREVSILEDLVKSPGLYDVAWSGSDGEGKSVVSGLYIISVRTDSHSNNKKVMLLR